MGKIVGGLSSMGNIVIGLSSTGCAVGGDVSGSLLPVRTKYNMSIRPITNNETPTITAIVDGETIFYRYGHSVKRDE